MQFASSVSKTSSWTLPLPTHLQAPRRCLRLSRRQYRQVASSAEPRRAMSEADLYVSVSPAPAAQPTPKTTKIPFYIYGPLAFLAVLGILRTIGALIRRSRNRGSLSEEYRRHGIADEVYYDKLMKGMKRVQYEELSEDQIMAARRRRMRETARDNAPLDLDQMEIPDNHPFAVKKKLSPEEEGLQAQRLRARRGLSEEDKRKLEEVRRQSRPEE